MRKIALLLSSLAATAAIGVGIASAAASTPAPQSNASPPGVRLLQRALPTCRPGTVLWAVVNSDGTLARASRPGTTSRIAPDGGPGDYEVMFNLNIRNAAYVVSPGSAGALGVAPSGETSVQGDNDNIGGVFIGLRDHTGAPLTDGLHLVVAC